MADRDFSLILFPDHEYTFTEKLEDVDTIVNVIILDPEGNTITEGPASNEPAEEFSTVEYTNIWRYKWNTPSFGVQGFWTIKWSYTTNDGASSKEIIKQFILKQNEPDNEPYRQNFLMIENSTDYTYMRLTSIPEIIGVSLYKVGDLDGLLTDEKLIIKRGVNQLRFEDRGDYVNAFFDIPKLLNGTYLINWEYRYTSTSPKEMYVDQLLVIPLKFMSLIKNLRLYIDKIQKRTGIIQAYNDAELWRYFQAGLEYINSTVPISSWSLGNNTFPFQSFNGYLNDAAAYRALRAQYLLEGDLGFDYAGQTISLNYDHLGFLESEIGRLEQNLSQEKLGVAKQQQEFNSRPSALVAMRTNRPYIVQTFRR